MYRWSSVGFKQTATTTTYRPTFWPIYNHIKKKVSSSLIFFYSRYIFIYLVIYAAKREREKQYTQTQLMITHTHARTRNKIEGWGNSFFFSIIYLFFL
jgi:hypothetical protein